MSSLLVFFRALVMLACLLAIPLLAMFYGDLPESVRDTLRRGRSILADRLATEDAPASPPLPSVVWEASPTSPDQRAASSAGARTAADETPAPEDRPALPRGVPPARTGSAPPASPTVPTAPTAPPASPANFDAGATLQPAMLLEPDPPRTPAVTAAERDAEFLRTLGAVDYALQRWGSDDPLYRFRCRMRMAEGDRQVCRHFEAVDVSPREAVQKVVLAVQAWRQQR